MHGEWDPMCFYCAFIVLLHSSTPSGPAWPRNCPVTHSHCICDCQGAYCIRVWQPWLRNRRTGSACK